MFKNLVTNLPYSPGLVKQMGFYASRLKREEFTRRLGMIFGIFALLLNMNIMFFGPENSVLASPGNDVITGGIKAGSVKAMQDATINAIKNDAVTRAIFDYYEISEADIRGTTKGLLNTADQQYRSVGRQSFGRGGEVCRTHNGAYFCERSMFAAYRYKEYNVYALIGQRDAKVGESDPWFAILESCGNVVIRVGNDEDITIKKTKAPKQNTKVQPGDEVDFRLTISSNNENGAKNPVIKDTLPEHTSYVSHTPKDLFDKVSINGRTLTLSSSNKNAQLGPFEDRVIDLTLKVNATAPDGARLCNSAEAQSLGDTAITIEEPCVDVDTPEEPAMPACVALRVLSGGAFNSKVTFEAEVNPDGADVSSYMFDFGDGNSETKNSTAKKQTATHTYSPGSYTAKVVIKTSEGDVGGSGACAINVQVDEPVPDPVVSCTYLNLLSGSGSDLERTFEAAADAQNGATVQGFVFDFGDGESSEVTNNGQDKARTTHTYASSGNYTVQATVESSVGNVTNDTSCVLNIEIDPEPCPYNESINRDDESCVPPTPDGEPNIIKRKKAANITQELEDAHGTIAKPGDVIEYSLITENDGDGTAEGFVVRENMADVFQYAELIDEGGGTLSDDGFVITWPAQDIEPGQVVTNTITVKIKNPVPSTPVSVSDPLAWDLTLENAYGNNVTIEVPPPPAKQVEGAVKALPETGNGANAMLSTVFIGMITYFYFRNRLITKELGLIKNEFTGGGSA